MGVQTTERGVEAGLSRYVPGTGGSVLLGPATEAMVRRGLAPPFRGFAESDGGAVDIGWRMRAAMRAGGLVLSLSTASAWALDLNDLIDEALRCRFGPLDVSMRQQFDICLSESLGNALIHGNLGLDSRPRESLSGLISYLDKILQRLADPHLASKRIELTVAPTRFGGLRMTVSDDGGGFDIRPFLGYPILGAARHGQGVPLIGHLARSVDARDHGRTLVMRFFPA